MPIYEYQCKSCKDTFELLVKSYSSRKKNRVVCPSCGGKKVDKILSAFGMSCGKSGKKISGQGRGSAGSCASCSSKSCSSCR